MEDVSNFEGSEEEAMLKKCLHLIEPLNFNNFVIKFCNAITPVSFSSADIVLHPLYEEHLRGSVQNKTFYHQFGEVEVQDMVPCYTKVTFQQLFNMDIVKELSTNGVKGLKEQYKPALWTVLTFLRNLKFHVEALSSMRALDDTKVTAIIVVHLLSQLIPGKDYVTDNRSGNVPQDQGCPCQHRNCSASIWHGYADVVVNQKIAVSVLPKQSTSDEEKTPGKGAEDTVSMESPPAAKRVCRHDQDSSEVKDTVRETAIMDYSVSKQMIAQTITNAFAQLNVNPGLLGWLIPTLCCTRDDFVVILYDPKNDVLLQCETDIPIWVGNTLSMNAVIQIWMLLNFTVFMNKNLADEYEIEKSNFHNLVDKMLPLYWSASNCNNFSGDCSPIEETYKRMLRTCRLWAKEAPKKRN